MKLPHVYLGMPQKKYIDVEDYVNQLDIHRTIKIKTYNKENNNEQRKQKI